VSELKQLFRTFSILGIILGFFIVWFSQDPDNTFNDKSPNDVFLEQIELGKNDFSGLNLSNMDLHGQDLTNIDFYGTIFQNTDLSFSNLTGS